MGQCLLGFIDHTGPDAFPEEILGFSVFLFFNGHLRHGIVQLVAVLRILFIAHHFLQLLVHGQRILGVDIEIACPAQLTLEIEFVAGVHVHHLIEGF